MLKGESRKTKNLCSLKCGQRRNIIVTKLKHYTHTHYIYMHYIYMYYIYKF